MLDFSKVSNQKIIVVGDVMLDAYFFGKVDRISPEAPVPIINFQKEEYRLGGAANVALNLASLGATPLLFGITGNDDDAGKLRRKLEENGINTGFLVSEEGRRTTVKTRVIGNNHQLLRIDKEDTSTLSADSSMALVAKLRMVICEASALIFEDYDKGALNMVLISDIIALCDEHKVPVIVDPKKRNFLSYKGATLFKPNLKEIKEGLKLDHCETLQEIESAAKKLLAEMKLQYLMVTLSERGVLICSREETIHIPAHVREIADVSGAGDTVVSIAALCLAQALDAYEIAALSNLAGGMVCEEIGVVPLNKDRFIKEMIDLPMA
jgi:rfaE bifunctional protein kinase chain/domain